MPRKGWTLHFRVSVCCGFQVGCNGVTVCLWASSANEVAAGWAVAALFFTYFHSCLALHSGQTTPKPAATLGLRGVLVGAPFATV